MKKVLAILLTTVILLSLASCGKVVDDLKGLMQIRTAADKVSEENLVGAMQGHWAIGQGSSCDGVSISDTEFVFWTYPGEYGLTGYIRDVTQYADYFEITVYYPSADHMGSYYEEETSYYYIYSNDNFLTTLVLDGYTFHYIGTPSELLSDACERYLNG
ncbi:MAG: hypothetical protein IJE24_03915 [Oscillospiraceae bacterium]|nr:hypothetical protein [Oscillospiraceae bacterium]